MTNNGNLTMRDRVAMLRLPDKVDESSTNNRATWLPWGLCILLAVCCTGLSIRSWKAAPPAPVRAEKGEAKAALPAATAANDAAPGAVVLESKGYIVPAHQIQVSPIEVSGRIVETFIEEGKRFNKGDVLARIDDESFRAEAMEAEANLLSAKAHYSEMKTGSRPEEVDLAQAELREAEESLKQAKLEYDRNKNIVNSALSIQEFEKAQYAYTSLAQKVKKLERQYELVRLGPRRERIDVAEAEMKFAEARLKRANWRLNNCVIKAPAAGTILKKTAELGNLVSALSFNQTSMSLCDMADLSDLEVDLEIPERDIAKVIRGMPCKVSTDAYPDRFYSGVVDRLMPIALQNKAAIQVRVKVDVSKDQEGVYLKPGMNTRVTFLQPPAATDKTK